MTATFRDVAQWVVTQLTNDDELQSLAGHAVNPYFYRAPMDAQLPYVILQKQTDAVQGVLDKQTGYMRHWFAIQVVSLADDGGDVARQMQDRIGELLDWQSAELDSGKLICMEPSTGNETQDSDVGGQFYVYVTTVYIVWTA